MRSKRGGEAMRPSETEPKLVLPFLQPFYDFVIPLSWPIVRVAVGWNLLVHGSNKLWAGPSAAALKGFGDQGFFPPELWFWLSASNEALSGAAIILGLFTQFFGATAAIELLVITVLYRDNGFAWMHRGYEYVLLWGLVCFAVALRGGGPYSLDRLIGRQL